MTRVSFHVKKIECPISMCSVLVVSIKGPRCGRTGWQLSGSCLVVPRVISQKRGQVVVATVHDPEPGGSSNELVTEQQKQSKRKRREEAAAEEAIGDRHITQNARQ